MTRFATLNQQSLNQEISHDNCKNDKTKIKIPQKSPSSEIDGEVHQPGSDRVYPGFSPSDCEKSVHEIPRASDAAAELDMDLEWSNLNPTAEEFHPTPVESDESSFEPFSFSGRRGSLPANERDSPRNFLEHKTSLPVSEEGLPAATLLSDENLGADTMAEEQMQAETVEMTDRIGESDGDKTSMPEASLANDGEPEIRRSTRN